DGLVVLLMECLLAMTLHPDVRSAAQQDIEAIVGRGRLPNLSDRAQLPYVDA
ncbi:hypothetical protein GGX14DRAFT_600481, partial [Mycena pura]